MYSQHASIMSSSETGKSRMMDELGKTTIAVPISGCLHKRNSRFDLSSFSQVTCMLKASTGYPPPDENLRD